MIYFCAEWSPSLDAFISLIGLVKVFFSAWRRELTQAEIQLMLFFLRVIRSSSEGRRPPNVQIKNHDSVDDVIDLTLVVDEEDRWFVVLHIPRLRPPPPSFTFSSSRVVI
jgi:hypothetical protein